MEKIPSFALAVRFKHRSLSSAKNDIRHELRRGPQPRYIDPDRSHLNSVIIKPQSPAKLRDLCKARRDQLDMQRAAKASDSVASSVIIGFGKGLQPHVNALDVEQQDALYLAIAEAVTKHLGIELTGLVSHRDETAPHGHGQTPARHPDGRPMGKVITPTIASEIQTIAMEVAKPFLPMIERGKRKVDRISDGDDPSAIYNRSVKRLHEDLPDELEAAEAALLLAIDRVSEMQARVDKLSVKAELSTKEIKRLSTYEKRLDDRRAELDAVKDKTQEHREKLRAWSEEARAAQDADWSALDIERAALEDDRKAFEVEKRALVDELRAAWIVIRDAGLGDTLIAVKDAVRAVFKRSGDILDGPS